MNADRLLKLYEKVAEAPDAIDNLRRFVLDLAVRGKLVEQDAAEEPASELLKRITAERKRLFEAGEIKRPKKFPPIDGRPFTLPSSWRWVRIREVTSDRGQRVPDSEFTYIDVSAINKETGVVAEAKVLSQDEAPSRARKVAEKGDVIYSCVRPYLLNVAVLDQSFDPEPIASTAFAVLNGYGLVLPWYLWIALRSPFLVGCVEANQRGQAYPAINDKDFSVLPLPLPPLAEQERIVAKVEELMALLDRLEAARTARETTRDRLTIASLARLTAPDTDLEAFPDHARFALDALPALTARAHQIKLLRQSVLNLAVRGKLVEQSTADESLQCFDEKISPEVELPFSIPTNWKWSRLQFLGTLKGGGTPSKSREEFWGGNIPWVSPKDMKIDYIDAAQLSITDEAVVGSAVKLIQPESVLFVVRGMILAHSFPIAISRVQLTINQDMKALELKIPEMAVYILYALRGLRAEILARVQRSSHGTCRIESSDYRDLLIPIPPLAEQRRIVSRVEELMALFDRFEAALRHADTTRARLLEAALHDSLEALAGKQEAA